MCGAAFARAAALLAAPPPAWLRPGTSMPLPALVAAFGAFLTVVPGPEPRFASQDLGAVGQADGDVYGAAAVDGDTVLAVGAGG